MSRPIRCNGATDSILLCNNAAHNLEFIKNCDAVMYEHYKNYREQPEKYVREWEEMLTVAENGKINVYRMPLKLEDAQLGRIHPGQHKKHYSVLEKVAKENVEFPLACFLIGAQPYSYVMLCWGYSVYSGALVEFPEVEKPLGPPLGAYKRQSKDTWIFTRQFKHADVWVDLETEEGRITWK